MKTQNGTIKRIGKSWYGRWREDAIVEGKIQRLQRFVKLAEFDDRYRAKVDVRPLLAEKLSALNEGLQQLMTPDATYVSLNFDNSELKKVEPWIGTHKGPKALFDVFAAIQRFWNGYQPSSVPATPKFRKISKQSPIR